MLSCVVAALLLPAVVSAQDERPRADGDRREQVETTEPVFTPITPRERTTWIVDGIVGPKSLASGSFLVTWQTAINSPHEWGRSSGFAKRYFAQEASTAISKGLEGGLGALWDEDPRQRRSHRQGFWPRFGYTLQTVVLAPRPDGRLAPAWGRMAGNVGSNVVENTWLPSRMATAKGTSVRILDTLLVRLASNLWTEFGPDLKKRFTRTKSPDKDK
jgi:hypothetical protein